MSSEKRDSSDDFFNSFSGPPTQKAELRSRNRPPPPPPPPGAKPKATRTNSASSHSIAKSVAGTQPRRSTAPPKRATTNRVAQTPYNNNSSGGGGSGSRSTPPSSQGENISSIYGITQQTSQPPKSGSVPTSFYRATPPSSNDWQQHPSASASTWQPSSTSNPQGGGPSPTVMTPYMLSTPNDNGPNDTIINNNNNNNFAPSAPASGGLEGAMDGGQTPFESAPTAGYPSISNPYLSGPMDSANGGLNQPGTFVPKPTTFVPGTGASNAPLNDNNNFDDEPPLLEELGINLEHIVAKTRAVVLPFQRFGGNMDATVIQDGDLVGPVALALLLGGELLLTGKIQFGYIYGFGLFGCLSMTLILNLMSPSDAISIWTVTSILGYALLPVNVLAVLKIFLVNLGRMETLGRILGILTVCWCTVASTRLMEQGCGMREQRYLIAYPIAMLYSAFVIITIF